MKVLLIDAGADIHEIVCMSLETDGMDVVSVTTPSDAMARAQSLELDVILLDYGSGGSEGIDTMTLLRSQRAIAHVPIIFLASRPEPVDVAQMLAAGAAGLIGKPLDPRELGDQIRSILRGDDQIALSASRRESLVCSDLVAALREYDSAREGFFATLARNFLEEAHTHVQDLERNIDSGNAHALRERARALSDMAGNVGATRLSAEAHRVEKLLHNGETKPGDLVEALHRLRELESLTRQAFDEMLESEVRAFQ